MNLVKSPIAYKTSNNELLVWWETDSRNTVGHGAIVQPAGQASFSVIASSDMVLDYANQPHAVHRIVLKDLPQDRLITVTPTGPGYLSSASFSFRTTNPTAAYRFGVLNSPEGYYGDASPELGYALEAMGAVDLYLSCGGIAGHQPSYEQWSKWYSATYDRVGMSGILVAKSSLDIADPVTDRMLPTTSGDRYYATSVGPVRIVALDTSLAGRRSLVGAQRDWALNEFNSAAWKSADYRMILSPDPFRVSLWDQSQSFGSGTGTDKFLFTNLYPLLQQSGADLVLAGRVHSYQRGAFPTSYPNHAGQVTHYVACGGMAPAHRVNAWQWDVADPPGIIVSTSDHHYVTISVSPGTMQVTCQHMTTNAVLDEFEVGAHTLY